MLMLICCKKNIVRSLKSTAEIVVLEHGKKICLLRDPLYGFLAASLLPVLF